MPEGRGAARGRRTSEEKQNAGEGRARTVRDAPQRRAAHVARDAGRRERHHRCGAGIGSEQQRRTRAGARPGRRGDDSDDAASAPAGGALDQPAQCGRAGFIARTQHRPRRGSGTRHDEGPGEGYSRHRGRQREPQRGCGQRRAQAAEHHGERAGACVGRPQATQPARRLGHLVPLTAYVKRFTPIRSAASCSSGGS